MIFFSPAFAQHELYVVENEDSGNERRQTVEHRSLEDGFLQFTCRRATPAGSIRPKPSRARIR
jgi:hypothetical protein